MGDQQFALIGEQLLAVHAVAIHENAALRLSLDARGITRRRGDLRIAGPRL